MNHGQENSTTSLFTAPSLECYQCRYHEIMGKADRYSTDKESCYSSVGLELVPCNVVTNGPLVPGNEFRCYTEPYEQTSANGEIGKYNW